MSHARLISAAGRLGFVAVGPPRRLTGGNLNVVLRLPVAGGSVILKHAPPYVASNPAIPLDPARQDFEARALGLLGRGTLGIPAGAVAVPKLLARDEEATVLVLEDLGDPPHLGHWLERGGALGALASLGRFLAELHVRTASRPALAQGFRNSAVQQTRHVLQYTEVGGWLARAGIADAYRLGQRAIRLGVRFQQPGRCLTHGDLWPPSVLVHPRGLRLIDWELCHWGQPAQDLGHLKAHLFIWAAHRGVSADCWSVFEDAYSSVAPLDAEDRRDMDTHAGCELAARAAGPFAMDELAREEARESALQRAAAWIRG